MPDEEVHAWHALDCLALALLLSLEVYISFAHRIYKSVLIIENRVYGDEAALYVKSNGKPHEQTCILPRTIQHSAVISDSPKTISGRKARFFVTLAATLHICKPRY